MTKISRSAHTAGLLARLLDEPKLAQQLAQLSGDQLRTLVARVGIEDSGELIGLLEPPQLLELMDEDLWFTDEEGTDRFDAARFLHLLDVLFVSGAEHLRQRLSSFSSDFLVFALSHLIAVYNTELLVRYAQDDEDGLAEKKLESLVCEELDEYLVCAKMPEGWDIVWQLLVQWDEHDHDLLERLLSRLATLGEIQIEESGGLSEALDDLLSLHAAEAGEREDRRASLGFVSSADAKAFLKLPRLERAGERDAISRAYFRRLSVRTGTLVSHALSTHLRELLPPASKMPLLSGDSPFSTAMKRLSHEQPALFDEFVEEVYFLVNVLVSDDRASNRASSPGDALAKVKSLLDQSLLDSENPLRTLTEWRPIGLFRRVDATDRSELLGGRGNSAARGASQ